MLVLFLVFSFFNALYSVLTSVYPSEVFPTEIRGIGTGFAVSRVGAGAATFLLPPGARSPWQAHSLRGLASCLMSRCPDGLSACLT